MVNELSLKLHSAGLLDVTEDGIVTVDDRQQIVLFNGGAEKLFGYDRTEVIGRPLELLMPRRYAANHRDQGQSFAEGQAVSRTMGERKEVYGCRKGAYPVANSVRELERLESQTKLYDRATHESYARATDEKRRKLFDTIHQLKRAGKKIIGIGAPAKASTVCTYCRIGPDLLDYITEINPLRIGTYLPGVRIPIVDEKYMFEDPRPADAAVLFAWNYYDEVIPKLRKRGFKGEIICP